MTTKKVTKKVVIKKTAPKKTTTKSIKKAIKKSSPNKKKPLVYADNNNSFWVSDGQILNSLMALRDALELMENEVYEYHAGKAQNDFSNWVSAVLADSACAKDLKKARTCKSAKTAVVRHLKLYSV